MRHSRIKVRSIIDADNNESGEESKPGRTIQLFAKGGIGVAFLLKKAMKMSQLPEETNRWFNKLLTCFTFKPETFIQGGKKFMTRKAVTWFLPVFILFWGISVLAQRPQKPDFSGVWKFNPEKSKLQTLVPSSSTFIIDHKEPKFHLSRTHVYEGKPNTLSFDLTTDGKEVVKQEGDHSVRIRLCWDGNDLIFNSVTELKDGQATNVVRYHLSPDGKIFTATESFRDPMRKHDNVWVFDKELSGE